MCAEPDVACVAGGKRDVVRKDSPHEASYQNPKLTVASRIACRGRGFVWRGWSLALDCALLAMAVSADPRVLEHRGDRGPFARVEGEERIDQADCADGEIAPPR